MTLRICIGAVFFDEVAISSAEQAPIEITEIISLIILSVLGEFSRESRVGRTMQSRHEPLDNSACEKLERIDLGQQLGIEKARRSLSGRRLCRVGGGSFSLFISFNPKHWSSHFSFFV